MALIANPQHPGETQELDAARGAAATARDGGKLFSGER
jgi:hypothetical protein